MGHRALPAAPRLRALQRRRQVARLERGVRRRRGALSRRSEVRPVPRGDAVRPRRPPRRRRAAPLPPLPRRPALRRPALVQHRRRRPRRSLLDARRATRAGVRRVDARVRRRPRRLGVERRPRGRRLRIAPRQQRVGAVDCRARSPLVRQQLPAPRRARRDVQDHRRPAGLPPHGHHRRRRRRRGEGDLRQPRRRAVVRGGEVRPRARAAAHRPAPRRAPPRTRPASLERGLRLRDQRLADPDGPRHDAVVRRSVRRRAEGAVGRRDLRPPRRRPPRNRKLATFRGAGAGDMLEGTPDWWAHGQAMSLDDFYRRALAQG